MTKEIIIDGCNVAECEFLRKCVIPDNEGCKIDDSLCCDVGNCYYKQLHRLKKENEELKKRCGELDKMTGIFSARLADKYKQALKEIREIAKNTCKTCTSECDCILDGEPCKYYGFYHIRELIDEVLDEEV